MHSASAAMRSKHRRPLGSLRGTDRLGTAYPITPLNKRTSTILAPGQDVDLLQRAAKVADVASEASARSDEAGCLDREVWSALRDTGLARAPFPSALGGAGLGLPGREAMLCSVLRLIGAADLSLARLFEGHVNAVMLVVRYGKAEQVEALADSVGKGGLSGVWGAEDAVGLRRESYGGSWSLIGRKIFASGAGSVSRPLVTVTTPCGQVLYLLDFDASTRADHGAWTPLGMRASASGTVDLTGIVVGRSEQVGEVGDFMRQPFFSGGAWRFCAAQLGAMERLCTLYCEHLRARGRGQDPLQLQRIAQCTAACGTTLFWVEEASKRLGDDSLEPAAVVAFSNLTRMVTERAALDVLEHVQRGVGLSALIRPNPIERICRDLATYLRQPVPDLAMTDAARAVLDGTLSIGVIT
jgi:alkylation response protein AidB-like acyl-CoA dehydrogenase